MQDIHEIVRCFDPIFGTKGGPRERAVSLSKHFVHMTLHFRHSLCGSLVSARPSMAGQPGTSHCVVVWVPVVPVFVFDKNILDKLGNSRDARVTFLHDRMCVLQADARQRGADVHVRHSTPMDTIAALADTGMLRACTPTKITSPTPLNGMPQFVRCLNLAASHSTRD